MSAFPTKAVKFTTSWMPKENQVAFSPTLLLSIVCVLLFVLCGVGSGKVWQHDIIRGCTFRNSPTKPQLRFQHGLAMPSAAPTLLTTRTNTKSTFTYCYTNTYCHTNRLAHTSAVCLPVSLSDMPTVWVGGVRIWKVNAGSMLGMKPCPSVNVVFLESCQILLRTLQQSVDGECAMLRAKRLPIPIPDCTLTTDIFGGRGMDIISA